MDKATGMRVRERAAHRCEYCRIPQSIYFPRFQIEHIIARQHGGLTVLDNLALACVRCNLHKSPNIAGIDPLNREQTRLFHPRQDRWVDHFSWNGATIEGKTPIGRATIAVLAMNDPDFVAVRRQLQAEGVRFSDSAEPL